MVIIFAILFALARLEKEVTRCHLKDHAGEGPEVGARTILGPNDHFWRAVLPSLNLCREVVVCPTAIAQVAYLEFEVLSEFWSSSLRPVLLNLMLDLPWVQYFEFQVGYPKSVAKLIIAVDRRDSISYVVQRSGSGIFILKLFDFSLDSHLLTLLELLAVFHELVKLSAIGLIPIQVVAIEGGRCHPSLLHLLHLLDQ